MCRQWDGEVPLSAGPLEILKYAHHSVIMKLLDTFIMKHPTLQEVPSKNSDAGEFRDFVDKYNPTELFRHRWGAEYADRASELDSELTRQLNAGQSPQASVEELLFSFCGMWFAAPYLGIDSLDEFLRNRRALWLLDGIRRHLETEQGMRTGSAGNGEGAFPRS